MEGGARTVTGSSLAMRNLPPCARRRGQSQVNNDYSSHLFYQGSFKKEYRSAYKLMRLVLGNGTWTYENEFLSARYETEKLEQNKEKLSLTTLA